MRLSFIIISTFYCVFISAQTIPVNRTVNWQQAGITEEFSEPATILNYITEGGIPDGITPNDAILNTLLNTINTGDSAVIFFPHGTYFFQEKISIPEHVILRGESVDSSIFIFNLLSENHLIEIKGSALNDTSFCISNSLKDNTSMLVNNPTLFQKGDFIYISDNDSTLITSAWALGATGQICKIDSISGNKIFLKSELRRDFLVSNNTHIRKLKPSQNAGIEHVKIIRNDSTSSHTDNIHIEYAYNCKVHCVESFRCNFAHTGVVYSSNIEISGSYFHDAFNYGGGGNAYGVMLHFGSGECLVTENHFNHLRHSLILQAGANGNVMAYNFSRNPFWTGVISPSNSAGDLVLHGNYPYANLFEGNTVQNIVIDDSHGKNGNFNTFFRNRALLYGFFMNSGIPTNNQNIVGNEITNTGFLLGLYSLSGTGHFEFGNNHKGVVVPNGTNNLPEYSLYLQTAPAYYINNATWPPIGIPNNINEHHIEMEELFLFGKYSLCSNEIIAGIKKLPKLNTVQIYPNPCFNVLHISVSATEIEKITILSATGKELFSTYLKSSINTDALLPGLYLVKIFLKNGTTINKSFEKF